MYTVVRDRRLLCRLSAAGKSHISTPVLYIIVYTLLVRPTIAVRGIPSGLSSGNRFVAVRRVRCTRRDA